MKIEVENTNPNNIIKQNILIKNGNLSLISAKIKIRKKLIILIKNSFVVIKFIKLLNLFIITPFLLNFLCFTRET